MLKILAFRKIITTFAHVIDQDIKVILLLIMKTKINLEKKLDK